MAGDVILARVVRDGVVEAVHRGHVAVADATGRVTGLGDPHVRTYPRSAVKPAQAAAVLEAVEEAGGWDAQLGDPHAALAIAAASHAGGLDHQVEAAHLLAVAGLDESALRCPPAWPADPLALSGTGAATRLAHNCSGKHAGFLLAQVGAGDDPARYLDPSSGLQQRVRARIEAWSGASAGGPGVDGCGAPAWTLPLVGLARLFAHVTTADARPAARVAAAMRTHPDLVGGHGAADTRLMLAVPGALAKRGAEGVLAASTSHGLAVAVKISDGAARAALPVVAAVLDALGVAVPAGLTSAPVLGGGEPHGRLEVVAGLGRLAEDLG